MAAAGAAPILEKGRSGPAVGGYILTLFIDSCQDRVAVPIVLASVRCSASEMGSLKARNAGLQRIQSVSQSRKTRENGRYRKSAGRCVGEAAANKEVQCCMLRARLLLSMAAPCVAALGASQVSA